MEAIALEAFTDQARAEIFSHFNLNPLEWQDLGGFESFVFADPQSKRIFKITHISHRSLADIQAEIEFLHFLGSNGAAVSAPIPFSNGAMSGVVGEFIGCLFMMAPGKLIEESDWQPALFENWGASIGQFHSLASQYTPEGRKRFDWRFDANLDFRSRVPASEDKILKLGDDHLAKLEALPVDPECYGLIHTDAHPGNCFLQDQTLTFFDFDDCCYQWYVFDVATVLFSAVQQPWVDNSPEDRAREAQNFLPHFLKGYDGKFGGSDFILKHMALFLKLRELSLYAVIHSHMDVDCLDGWYPIKFMTGRQARLEEDLPYLEIDFTSL